MSEHIHHTPEQNRQSEMRETVGMLTKDYRNSFKYSQGSVTLQTLLFTLLRDQYQQTDEATREQIPQALAVIGSQLGRFVVPNKHEPIKDSTSQFKNTFDDFRNFLTTPDYMPDPPYPPYAENHDERLSFAIRLMQERDVRFIAQGSKESPGGRPNRETTSELYESKLRTYILEGQGTHSDAYNTIFRDARQQLAATYPQTGLDRLQEEWESRHRGQDFYPPQFINALDQKQPGI